MFGDVFILFSFDGDSSSVHFIIHQDLHTVLCPLDAALSPIPCNSIRREESRWKIATNTLIAVLHLRSAWIGLKEFLAQTAEATSEVHAHNNRKLYNSYHSDNL